ncbi:hypothetical protein [Micromonospora siamensis]|uniref:Uncharacterized protein n=1 Tax=Micromonospora siamensis TaxID=299152 RepID=A0A1C5IWV1_9ACTN|nr:hypothetical protein [Micromonospora siamensis]SCG62419.1 hypothetical protein GA0074704_3862 [Micromonospora siamensis]
MSEWFETIADIEATPEEADQLGAEVLSWLVEQGIVAAEPTLCILGDHGHRPGPDYAAATVEPCDDLPGLATNGFRVVTGQSVFYSMGVDQVVCPRCEAVVVDDQDRDSWSDFSPVVDEWCMGGTGVRACGHCGEPVGINEWRWSPPWGFGYLGFEFWNWPMLDPGFVAAVSNRLGHRTVQPSGKL